jgi:hypothetical protein
MTPQQALDLLSALGASPWLVRHHELVLEAAELLCDRIGRDLAVSFDRSAVLLGAALHDAGKIVHPDEMSAPGHQHEIAGRLLLSSSGIADDVARFCVTHAEWDGVDVMLEDLLVAAADKLWKGKRDEALEKRLAERIAMATGREAWEVFDRLDSICESIAADGNVRLGRSTT